MGFEGGQGTAPQAAPTEPAPAKPAEVVRDPQSPAVDAAPINASQAEGDNKAARPKPKRKVLPDAADGSDHRSAETRLKTSKVAKRHKKDDDTVSDTRSGSEATTNRPKSQAEEDDGTPPRDRRAASSVPAKITTRDVPLPPRLPRVARSNRTGVAPAGPQAIEALRADTVSEQPSGPKASQKAVRGLTPAMPSRTAQPDVSHPAPGNVVSAASPTADKTATGGAGDRVTTIFPPPAGSNVTPAIVPPKVLPQVAPRTEDPQRTTRDSVDSAALHTPTNGAAVLRPTPPANPTVPLTSDPGRVAARAEAPPLSASNAPAEHLPAAASQGPGPVVGGASSDSGSLAPAAPASASGKAAEKIARPTDAPAPAIAAAGEEPAKRLPNIAGKGPAAIEGSGASGSLAPVGQAVAPASSPEKAAHPADAPPPAMAAAGQDAAKHLPNVADNEGAAVVRDTSAPGSLAPVGQAAPASGPNKDFEKVGRSSDALSPAVAVSAEETGKPLPNVADVGSPVPVGQAAAPVVDGRKQATTVTPSMGDVGGTSVAPVTAAAKTPSNTLGSGSTPVIDAAKTPEAAPAPASTVTAGPGRNEDPARSAASPAATTESPVPVPAQALDHRVPVASLNEPSREPEIAPRGLQTPLASPQANRGTVPAVGADAERPAPVAPSRVEAPVSNGSGATVDQPKQAPPSEIASIAIAPPVEPASADRNAANIVTVAIGNVSAEPKGTTIAYTITNPAASLVDLLFIRCNAVDPKGTILSSAFDYVENIPAGQQVKRIVRMPSDVAPSSGSFSCAIDAATQ